MTDYLALTARQAAVSLHARMNERHLPHVDEIEAILRQIVGQPTAPVPEHPLHAKIRALMPQHQAAITATCAADAKAVGLDVDIDTSPDYIAALAHENRVDAELKALYAELYEMPVRSFEDAVIRAQLAKHYTLDWAYPEGSNGLEEPDGYDDERALAQVLMAVLALAQIPFSRYGHASAQREELHGQREGRPCPTAARDELCKRARREAQP